MPNSISTNKIPAIAAPVMVLLFLSSAADWLNRASCSSCCCLSLIIFSCKSNKYTSDTLPDEQLHFGSSGGFTGFTTTYILLKNGQVFYQKKANADLEQKEAQRKKVGKEHFEKASSINWETLPPSEPGNMNYFVVWKNGKDQKQYYWSGKCPDEKVGKWFEELNRLTKYCV